MFQWENIRFRRKGHQQVNMLAMTNEQSKNSMLSSVLSFDPKNNVWQAMRGSQQGEHDGDVGGGPDDVTKMLFHRKLRGGGKARLTRPPQPLSSVRESSSSEASEWTREKGSQASPPLLILWRVTVPKMGSGE